jgi:hypothetical protein
LREVVGLHGKEILADKKILMTISIPVSRHEPKGWRPLRRGGQEKSLKTIVSAVQEHQRPKVDGLD